MAIRDNFRRAFRRSDSSGSSQTDSNSSKINSTTASSEASEPPSLHKTSSRLTWSWSSKEKDTTKERKPKNKTKKRVIHPSERQLTAQNLAHQEMLSHFTMTFGASNPQQIEADSFMGISPCCTRTPSLAGDETDDGSAPCSERGGSR
ncbi:Fc.00g112400.m01.CDS01 [Cosmosporella sp. VM-42]